MAPDSVDMIISASTVQWFNSLPGFLERCAGVLAPGGLVVISSERNGYEVNILVNGTDDLRPLTPVERRCRITSIGEGGQSGDIAVHRRIQGIDLLPEDLDHTTAPQIF